MSTHVPGFMSFFMFLHDFLLTKLASRSIRVNLMQYIVYYVIHIIHVHVCHMPGTGTWLCFNYVGSEYLGGNALLVWVVP